MTSPASTVAGIRRRDLLLTLTMLGIALTPAWLLPERLAVPWQIAVAVLAGPMIVLSWTHGPWQPTPPGDLARIIQHLSLDASDRFVDLGAGDGRVVLSVARATGAHCTGIEAAPLMVIVGMFRTRLGGAGRARIQIGDLYRADLSPYDAAYVWGTAYSVGTEAFARSLQQRLRTGARLVSYQHPLVGWTPANVDHSGERPIFVYDVGPAADEVDRYAGPPGGPGVDPPVPSSR